MGGVQFPAPVASAVAVPPPRRRYRGVPRPVRAPRTALSVSAGPGCLQRGGKTCLCHGKKRTRAPLHPTTTVLGAPSPPQGGRSVSSSPLGVIPAGPRTRGLGRR